MSTQHLTWFHSSKGINLNVTKSDEVQLDRELENIRKNLLAVSELEG